MPLFLPEACNWFRIRLNGLADIEQLMVLSTVTEASGPPLALRVMVETGAHSMPLIIGLGRYGGRLSNAATERVAGGGVGVRQEVD